MLAEFGCSSNLARETLPFSVQALESPVCQFLSRSLTGFLNFGQFLIAKEEGSFKELAEIYGSSFLNTAVTFKETFSTLSETYQHRLINLNCPYWTVSCLRKLPKIPLEQFENFLNQVEAMAQELGAIPVKQVETSARQFLVRRRNSLSLGQWVTWEARQSPSSEA